MFLRRTAFRICSSLGTFRDYPKSETYFSDTPHAKFTCKRDILVKVLVRLYSAKLFGDDLVLQPKCRKLRSASCRMRLVMMTNRAIEQLRKPQGGKRRKQGSKMWRRGLMLMEAQSGSQLRRHKKSVKGSHAHSQVGYIHHGHMPDATCHPQASAKHAEASNHLPHNAIPTGSGHRMIFMDRTVEAPIGSEGGPIEQFAVCGATGNGTSHFVPLYALLKYASLDNAQMYINIVGTWMEEAWPPCMRQT